MSEFIKLHKRKQFCHNRRDVIKEHVVYVLGIRGWNRLLHLCNINGLLYMLRETISQDGFFPDNVMNTNLLTVFGEDTLSPIIGIPTYDSIIRNKWDLPELKSVISKCLEINVEILNREVGAAGNDIYKLYEEYTALGGEIGVLKSRLIEISSKDVGYICYIR